MHSLTYVAIVTGAFALAGFVKGVIGLGLPTVSIGLLSLVMAPVEAVALLFVPSLVTNIWQLAIGPNFRPLLARQRSMLISICVGIAIGSYLFGTVQYPGAKRWLGVSLLAYSALGVSPFQFHVRQRDEPFLSPVIGAVTGILASITGVFMIPNVPYLQALGLDRDDLIQALGLSFTVSTVTLGIGLAAGGSLPVATLGVSLLTLAPALAGMAIGQVVRGRISPPVFRACFFIGMALLGAELALEG
ncbi:MAG: sulfite exporter TauE/SafE family protein [Methylobacteriaceae bacterium]|nr:sulfite exporter TauE/SafE family protein [Methylobacteriaceae bacterium]